MPKFARYMVAKRGIAPQLIDDAHQVCSIGYSRLDGKWYGWSHRAMFGFKVGSKCRKGNCHYRASCIADEIEAAIAFWSDESHPDVRARVIGPKLIKVSWDCKDGKVNGVSWSYDAKSFGRGEWDACTTADAKQMAIDFANGVS